MASVVGRQLSVEEIATELGLPASQIARHVGNLLESGLLESSSRGRRTAYRFCRQPLLDALRGLSQPEVRTGFGPDVDEFDEKVLGTFMTGGRLNSIPAQQKKRDVILRFLAEQFEVERMYSEREVNELLAAYHPDVASLRRYLVDGDFLRRQIVREVEAEALIAGIPEIDYRNMYWKPTPDEQSEKHQDAERHV
jgi:hypothetical protein